MPHVIRCILGTASFFCLAFPVHASFHTFRINEIYSNAEGTIQFVELKESAGASGQNFFSGNTLVSANGSSQQTFVFTRNLPSSATAGKSVLIGTQGFAALGLVAPDFIVADGFLFQPAGSINFADVDTVSYNQLPGDGTTSINRNGVPQTNSPQNFAGQTGTIPGAPSGVTEFYNTTLNFYFVTASAIEGASIDAGGSGPGWTRTGNVFKSGGPNAVCRFRGVPAGGGPPPASHFYTADADECNQVKLDPGWFFESLDFATTPALPGPTGATCPAGLLPVYRAYNGRFAQHESNHRITTNFAAYQQQIAAGWNGEGIVMCAQP
jgi:Repeat of unknown function (DUF5648)